MPIVFMILAIVTSKVGDSSLPAMDISLDKYADPITLASYSAGNRHFADSYCDRVISMGHRCNLTDSEDNLIKEMIRLVRIRIFNLI